MTIAMCYVSPEGVVLGADSTSSLMTHPGVFHFFNHNQKVFQLGSDSTVGIITWGLGSVGLISHRTHFAILNDNITQNKISKIEDIAKTWASYFGPIYNADQDIANVWAGVSHLHGKVPFKRSTSPPPSSMRTEEEENQYWRTLNGITVGFCFGGYDEANRSPEAWFMIFNPTAPNMQPMAVPMPGYGHWGVPNMIKRLIWGYDEELEASIIASGFWNASPADLRKILDTRKLDHAMLPVRDAIDFVHTCIYSTIKAMKFSNQAQVCGGPIEIAVITTDRKFRWVKHKPWNAAIVEGEHRDATSDREK